MNVIATIALILSVAAASGSAFAQSPSNPEIDPPGYTPPLQRKATVEEKAEGKATRRQAGREAAREDTHAEAKSIPDAVARVPKDERRAARVVRKAETKRANKAGEITSRGEVSSLSQ